MRFSAVSVLTPRGMSPGVPPWSVKTSTENLILVKYLIHYLHLFCFKHCPKERFTTFEQSILTMFVPCLQTQTPVLVCCMCCDFHDVMLIVCDVMQYKIVSQKSTKYHSKQSNFTYTFLFNIA